MNNPILKPEGIKKLSRKELKSVTGGSAFACIHYCLYDESGPGFGCQPNEWCIMQPCNDGDGWHSICA